MNMHVHFLPLILFFYSIGLHSIYLFSISKLFRKKAMGNFEIVPCTIAKWQFLYLLKSSSSLHLRQYNNNYLFSLLLLDLRKHAANGKTHFSSIKTHVKNISSIYWPMPVHSFLTNKCFIFFFIFCSPQEDTDCCLMLMKCGW